MRTVSSFESRDFRESAVVRSATVGSSVVAITDFGFTADELRNVRSCTVSAHGAGVNFLTTGNDPTTTLGVPLASGQTAMISGNADINNLKLVAQSVDAEVTIVFEWNLVS